uniref:Agenet domain-containing protein n=1 Tax=Kalanchoe fedtschenkoi TaxID=63787 RepID=A0A7N0URW9_KALFE
MSAGKRMFQSWEERMICEERGKRVVHFYLKDAAGGTVLVITGRETTIRHFKYCVTEEFSAAHGLRGSSAKPLKWRSRREAVKWLEKTVACPSRQHGKPRVHSDGSEIGHSKLISTAKQLTGSSGLACPTTAERLNGVAPSGSNRLSLPMHQHASPFRVGQRIEVLSQDSGIRGCWHRGVILKIDDHKCLKIEYDDLADAEDESIKLQEWVLAPRPAPPDELQMRCRGRLRVRPSPPLSLMRHPCVIGAPVDVWLWDGWWEGIVTRVSYPQDGSLQAYLPGERLLVTVETKDVRASRDWVNGRWIGISPKPDILSHTSSAVEWPAC